jgi:hypothetical protein
MRPQQIGRLSIPTAKGFEVREIDKIECLESDKHLTHVYLEDKEVITSIMMLRYFEDELKGHPFERVHNQTLVNLCKIKEYSRQQDLLILCSSKRVSISREKGKKVLKFLKSSLEEEEKTTDMRDKVGSLIVQGGQAQHQILPLKKGLQLVGRKSQLKPCDVMIETEDKVMSRNHFYIDSRENEYGDYESFIFIKEPVKTLLNQLPLEPGQEYPLTNRSVIRAGETDIVFVALASLEEEK